MSGPFADAVHTAIHDAMAASAIDQRRLAKRLGVTEARVTQMLNGGNLTLKTVDRIFAALSVDVSRLMR